MKVKYICQKQKSSSAHTMQDICLVCGDYLPEGTGMTFSYCSSRIIDQDNVERIRRGWSGDKAAGHNRVCSTAER